MSNDIAEEYASSLSDLTVNSKPLINMLTMLAEDNINHAPEIVKAVEKHLQKVRSDIKLPVLYLIDSIVKNVGREYTSLFTQNIVSTFCSVFEKVDERTRAQMFKLRQTWNDVFPSKKLYAVDVRVNSIDPAWPITAPAPTSIHVNPRFFAVPPQTQSPATVGPISTSASTPVQSTVTTTVASTAEDTPASSEAQMREQLLVKQKELLELQQKKLALELLQTKAKLEEQQKQMEKQTGHLQAQKVQQLLLPALQQGSQDAAKRLSVPKHSNTTTGPPTSAATAQAARQVTSTSKVSTGVAPAATNNKVRADTTAKQGSAVSSQSRDPRLAARQAVPASSQQSQDHVQQSAVFDTTKLVETGKTKPQIKINLAYPNKTAVNKERGKVSKDPRLKSTKAGVVSNSNTKGRVTSNSTTKGTAKTKGSPPQSPTKVPSLSRKLGKGNEAAKLQRTKATARVIDLASDSTSAKSVEKEEVSSPKENSTEFGGRGSSPLTKPESHKKKPVGSGKQTLLDKRKVCSKNNGTAGLGTSTKRENSSVTKSSLQSKSPTVSKSPTPKSPLRTKSPVDSKKHVRERLALSKYDMFEQESASPSPPPSPMITETKKRDGASQNDVRTIFKDVKMSTKNRKYVRRNRERSESRSPDRATGDVDLRVGAPPEKHPRLAAFQPDVPPTAAAIEEEPKKPVVDVVTKDVDLRQLPASPSKKRTSLERGDQPPSKKSKAEMFDALFGNEDVDLRQLTSGSVAAQPAQLQSPPPASSLPQAQSQVALKEASAKQSTSPKRSDLDLIDKIDGNGEVQESQGLSTKGWAKYKELKPDTFKSPSRTGSVSCRDDTYDISSKGLPSEHSHVAKGRDTFSRRPPAQIGRPGCDRLGRPLLYHRMQGGSDTDMRRPQLFDSESMDGENVNIIMSQAEQQLKNGEMTLADYNTLLSEVIRLNEYQKLREAQRRDEQENKENWERNRCRRRGSESPYSGDEHSPGPSFSPTDTSEMTAKQGSVGSMKYGDIDERFPVSSKAHKKSSSSTCTEPSPVGKTAFSHSGPPPPWGEVPHNLPPMTSTPWDAAGPWHRAPPTQAPPHMRMMHPASFHRPPAPDNFSVNRWRPPPFANRPPFEADMSSRFDRFGSRMSNARFPRGPLMPQSEGRELPPAEPGLLDMIAQDMMRTINIDGVPREIRFYGDTAVVMLAWDDPREIGFQDGSRRITFDDRDSIVCCFGESYRDFILDGNTHRIRLGAPTRELYIDGKWNECYFGGQPVAIEIGGKFRSVKLEGPPPQVKIGAARTDLVAGKINLIIDARTMVPVFLDAKPQRFDIEGKPHVLRFVNALTTVLINGRPFQVEFGGLPKPITVRDKKHFIRFTCLPHGVRPGFVNIVNMEGSRLPSPVPHPDLENSNSLGFGGDESAASEGGSQLASGHEPALPMLGEGRTRSRAKRMFGQSERDRDSPHDEQSRNSPFQADSTQPARPVGLLPLEMLTSLMPAAMAPASGFSYQVDHSSQDALTRVQETSHPPAGLGAQDATTSPTLPTAAIPFLPQEINVDELFQKLVATGIVPQADNVPTEVRKEEEANTIKPVDFKQPETLKVRQPGVIALLYSGIQCSSCGVRFPPEQTMKYSQHLDWHFRQNRRDRDNTRKAQSRKWYYDVSDWIQFEEIEDLEERAQSWFETQQAAEGRPEDKEVAEVPSVAAGKLPEDTFCDVCHDKFEQFYNEEREEWHLRLAVRVEGKTYHPLCYQDHKASLEAVEECAATEEQKEIVESQTDAVSADAALPESESVSVVELPAMESEQVQEIKPSEEDVTDLQLVEGVKMEIEEDIEEIVQAVLHSIKEDIVAEEISINLGKMKVEADQLEMITIKEEPLDRTEEEELHEPVAPAADTTHAAVACSIDGNVQFEDSPQLAVTTPMGGKIKINITKPLTVAKDQVEGPAELTEHETDTESEVNHGDDKVCDMETEIAEPEPPPPGLEAVQLKPKLIGRKLTEFPPVMKGTELSGLCSIM